MWNEHKIGEKMLVWTDKATGKITAAWYDESCYALKFTDVESRMDLKWFLKVIELETKEDKWRCSQCGKLVQGKDNLHYHLFATMACDECHEKLEQITKDEIARGAVCLMCHKPYSKCYC